MCRWWRGAGEVALPAPQPGTDAHGLVPRGFLYCSATLPPSSPLSSRPSRGLFLPLVSVRCCSVPCCSRATSLYILSRAGAGRRVSNPVRRFSSRPVLQLVQVRVRVRVSLSATAMVALSPVPEISISLAPPEEPLVEPFSPFSSCTPVTPVDGDTFRPALLSPPPVMSPRFPRMPSPLRPSDASAKGQGLERERFEELLRASRERNAAMGCKKSPDLRKEIAIKVHKSKQS